MKKSIAVLGGIAMAVLAQVAAAAEITVLSAGAIEPGLRAAVAAFHTNLTSNIEYLSSQNKSLNELYPAGGIRF